MKISVDQDVCIGAGQCVLSAEALFRQSPDHGLVELLEPEPAADQMAGAREAEMICPSGAISVDD
jgi:ferredoxin